MTKLLVIRQLRRLFRFLFVWPREETTFIRRRQETEFTGAIAVVVPKEER